ncbi:protein of unknown function [Candidatus Nitrosocosmicus franklandus]|uniref:Uncharacterized protein n=1 Tax=Candidatus Nitrosocosmicus franklandianus TaxID=1798806 RepID=A0A484I9Y7_9ARCH|nr:protein of unknown function [Candidatus Nitrosocosmicus franklandus]
MSYPVIKILIPVISMIILKSIYLLLISYVYHITIETLETLYRITPMVSIKFSISDQKVTVLTRIFYEIGGSLPYSVSFILLI